MILTPIAPDDLPDLLERCAAALSNDRDRAVFRRIARPGDAERAVGCAAAAHHAGALQLLASLGMRIRDGSPGEDFGWNGSAVRAGTEAYVLVHEAAHFQLAAPARRHAIDFGLGPGPETGAREEAERAALLFGLAREHEEAMASLLGVLWEAELGQPALASFLDQNWLEGAPRQSALRHFSATLAALDAGGFLTADGRPTQKLRTTPDDQESALRGPA
ncbi:MAG TPA: hypothetical protein VLX85_10895 [Stellaceae bacterium]|nr:hypothetical protein [Stellaceae bacterium]